MERKYLKELGVAEDLIDKIMAENGKDIEATKTKFADYDDLKTQITTANKTIQDFKDLDIDGIKKSADDYKLKFEQAETASQTKINELQFNHALDGALTGSKAKSAKAVKAFLDMEGLKLNGEEIVGLKEQLEKIKTENSYLFEDETPPPQFTKGSGYNPTADGDMNAARAVMGLPPQTK